MNTILFTLLFFILQESSRESLIIGTIGSILATIIVAGFVALYRYYRRIKEQVRLNKGALELGLKFEKQGITSFHFSRDDYQSTLSSFLEKAKHSISIVSISLKNTHDEGNLTDIFRKKLAGRSAFKIEISLLNPNNIALLRVASNTLNISAEALKREIEEMLHELEVCYQGLSPSESSRLKVMLHECFPMGSAVMLDVTPEGGIIQVETKLYKTSRSESFGFQITKDSTFFQTNYKAWSQVISDSKPYNFNKKKPKKNQK